MHPFRQWLPVVGRALAIAALSWSAAGHAADASVRVGYQKAGLLAVLKAQGSLEKKLAPLGFKVEWKEFPAGPQLLEALNAGGIDFGYTGAPPAVFAQAARANFVYVGAEPGGKTNEALFVLEKSPIRSVADLRGKRIALQRAPAPTTCWCSC